MKGSADYVSLNDPFEWISKKNNKNNNNEKKRLMTNLSFK